MQPFVFNLPEDLIAKKPAAPRDAARLLVYDRNTRSIVDASFHDLNKYLVPYTSLVLNNSKVENCRLLFPASNTEVFVLDKFDDFTTKAMVRPGRKFKAGQLVELENNLSAEVINIDEDGFRTLKFNKSLDSFELKRFEHIPLPPYIPQNDNLADDYQTVYASNLGSKAAPTAGLHFTNKLLNEISKNHRIAELTLHVGLGTFLSPTEEQIKAKKLHEETYFISAEAETIIKASTHITAVGTTATRTLESYALSGKTQAATDIFIQPGYEFKLVDSLITNFHLPGTSLLMLVEAFLGSREELERIYSHAINEKYRFYSFGDGMLII